MKFLKMTVKNIQFHGIRSDHCKHNKSSTWNIHFKLNFSNFLLDFHPKTGPFWLLEGDIFPFYVRSLMHIPMDHIDFYTKMSPFVKKYYCKIALLESPLSKSCVTLNKRGHTFLLCLVTDPARLVIKDEIPRPKSHNWMKKGENITQLCKIMIIG